MSERRDRTLGEAVQRIGEAKKLAADARNAAKRGEPPAGPPPKEVFAEACQKIGEAFAKDGFAFRKSGPKLVRRDGDFTETIAFQSSMHNVAGISVSLVCHVSLSSKALEAWRAEVKSPFSNTDFVGGGQLGNIRELALAIRAQLEQAASVATGSGYADELARISQHYKLAL